VNSAETYNYDVFISHADEDEEWVDSELLPRLEKAGLVAISKSNFLAGANELTEIEKAALRSRKTLLVLTPAYVADEEAVLGLNITQSLDPAAFKRRMIPVIREDCEPDWRIRPLVAVDLSDNSEKEWQKLLTALDPDAPEPTNPMQRLSLALSNPSVSLQEPGWHPIGSFWLLLGILTLILLVGLVNLLLHDSPALVGMLSAMVGAAVLILGFMGLKEDRDFFQRLTQYLGQSRLSQAAVGTLFAATLLLCILFGRPALMEALCGPLGCKPDGVQRIAFGQFVNLTPELTEQDSRWAAETRDAIIRKISNVSGLQTVNTASPQTSELVKEGLDYWIEGQFRMADRAELSSRLTGRGGQVLSPDVQVEGDPVETDENIIAMQNDLAMALLQRLGIEVDPDLTQDIYSTPTDNAQAIAENEKGVALTVQKEFTEAEEAFRRALALDPQYSAAHANLGFILASQGDYRAAETAHLTAVDLLPGYAPYHFNLGHLYSLLNRTDEAIISLNQAIELDPGNVQAMNELGNVHIRLDEWDKAREVLERGLRLDPEFAPLSKNLARVALAEGKPDEALELLQTALQLYDEKPLEVVYLLAEAQAMKGENTAACQEIHTFQTLDPSLVSEWAPYVLELEAELGC
jgi:tetratricopeptide (TPR) repeat protein